MKTFNKSIVATVGILLVSLSCTEPELPTANPFSSGATYKAYFSYANGTVNTSSLDFYVNGIKLGSAAPGIGSQLPTSLQIPTPGATGGVTANTSIRAKATSGAIGGLLGSNDLIYRSTSNGTNTFAATNLANYTVIAVDSVGRPIPKRLNRQTETIAFADVTYWNPNSQLMISASRRDSLNPANCRTIACPTCTGCDNFDVGLDAQNPSTATEFANLVTIGLVPLGLTDPGGVRFYVTTDAPVTFNAGNVATNAGIRFVNAIANSNNVTAVANANGTFGGPPVYARLNGGTPINLTNVAAAPNASNAFVNSVAGGFTPTTGSRTAGNIAFTSQAIAVAGVPNAYTLQLATDNAFANIVYSAPVTFNPGKNYTIVVRGKFTSLTGIQAGISHGVITH
ncbi:MAG: hypothetical protein JNL40_13710 [Cyclobacteriaceae bacterium]|nr:hypothetical protein [Cyclobacteriaceae bacterium]